MSQNRFTGKRVLVTGATGFLGANVVEGLLQQGATVCALSRGRVSPQRLSHLLDSPKLSLIQCDLLDAGTLQKTVSEFSPDVMYHFAAEPDKTESSVQAHAVVAGNITGTLNALDAFRQCNGELFVFIDSTKVYGNAPTPHSETTPVDPICSYAIGKVAAWNFCDLYRKIHGVPTVCVRPSLIYGPGQGYNLINYVVDTVASGKPDLCLMGGDQTRDPLYIDDAVEAFLSVGERPETVAGHIFNISGGVERTVSEIAQAVVDGMSATINITSNTDQARLTEIWRSYCDIKAAEKLLSWKPKVSLQSGTGLTIEYLLAEREKHASASA
ncbi:MAG: NAD-dependent epimerase/dehydratase family protein [Gammaproteobacteria bacterium]